MKLIQNNWTLILVFAFTLLVAPTAAQGQMPPPSYLHLEVQDQSGQLLSEVDVTIRDNQNQKTISVQTSETGGTSGVTISERFYTVQLVKPGYLPATTIYFGSTHGRWGSAPLEQSKFQLLKIPRTGIESAVFESELQKQQLFFAIKSGDAGAVQDLLRSGVDPNTVDNNGVPAIVWAATKGNAEIIKALFAAKAVIAPNKARRKFAPLEIYLSLSPYYYDPNGSQEQKVFPAQADEAVHQFIAAGAELNESTAILAVPWTPAHISLDTFRMLLRKGTADDRAFQDLSQRMLMGAARNLNADVLKVLLDAGATVQIKNLEDWSYLRYAGVGFAEDRMSSRPDKTARLLRMINVLLAAGDDVNYADNSKKTVLMVMRDSPEAIKVLLDHGATVDARDNWGNTALIYAVVDNDKNPEVVRLLLAAGSDVNAANSDGRTPLMEAVRYASKPAIVQILIEAGADVNATDKYGRTVWELAQEDNNPETLKLLQSAGAVR